MISAKQKTQLRCQSTKKIRGEVVQCEGELGHDTAHYHLNAWWPNKSRQPLPATVEEVARESARVIIDCVWPGDKKFTDSAAKVILNACRDAIAADRAQREAPRYPRSERIREYPKQ